MASVINFFSDFSFQLLLCFLWRSSLDDYFMKIVLKDVEDMIRSCMVNLCVKDYARILLDNIFI